MAIQLSRPSSQEIDQSGRWMEWIGDDPAIRERERGEELAVDLGHQDGLRRRLGAIQSGQPCERFLIAS